MECRPCGKPVQGVCLLCGRAVCREHAREMPFVPTIYVGANDTPKAVVVADALYYGQCRSQPEPIGMPDLH